MKCQFSCLQNTYEKSYANEKQSLCHLSMFGTKKLKKKKIGFWTKSLYLPQRNYHLSKQTIQRTIIATSMVRKKEIERNEMKCNRKIDENNRISV